MLGISICNNIRCSPLSFTISLQALVQKRAVLKMYQSLMMSFHLLMICLVFAMNVGYCRTEGNVRAISSVSSLDSLFNKYIKHLQ